ncbi:MAG: Mov34/MPN/PAD-1 family protein [Methanobacterium sp.]|jgi:proteasome lid subunit RPN8/RPN11|nr:Mov34/MPN/PAD-1 family protein [Methanobacterium sp.]
MENLSLFQRLMNYLLGTDRKMFQEVNIDREVVDEILQIARNSYPKEFVAMLQGKVKDNVLLIDGLLFLPGETSDQGAVMNLFMMPLIDEGIGSVHSHPGYNANPSGADLHFFSKNGLFHMIIAQPYTLDSINAYNSFGERVDFKVI